MIGREELTGMINGFFPILNSDDEPSYLPGQFDAIYQAVDACLNRGKKYVAIEGPTGCGKSVINYTIMKCINSDSLKNVYLTPQKILQDQIGAEPWSGISVIKGYSGYACNYCQGPNEYKYRCDYEGPDVETCNNLDKVTKCEYDFDELRRKIAIVHGACTNETALAHKSVFRDMGEYDELVNKLSSHYRNEYIRMTSMDNEDRPVKYRGMPHIDDDPAYAERTINKFSYESIGCPMMNVECPKVSSRSKAIFSDVVVMNPDVMYYMNRSQFSRYNEVGTLVVDECHGFDSVIRRIFEDGIPVSLLGEYGIDINLVYNSAKAGDNVGAIKALSEISETIFKPLMLTLNVLKSAAPIIAIHNSDTMAVIDSNTDAMKLLSTHYGRQVNRGNFSVLDLFVDAIDGIGNDAIVNYISGIKGRYYDEYGDVTVDIRPVIKNILSKVLTVGSMNSLLYDRSSSIGGGQLQAPKCAVVFDALMGLRKIIESFQKVIVPLTNGAKYNFILSHTTENRKFFVGKIAGCKFKENEYERVLNVVVVNTGAIARFAFYSKAEHVILSTGTWVYPDSMYRSLGINKSEVEFIKIPSSFDKGRRPAYIISDKRFTDYSEKDDGAYVYKTDGGTQKFTSELGFMVKWIRDSFSKKYNVNPNIIIHSHSFDITNRIAKYGDVDSSYIIHTNKYDRVIRNEKTGEDITMYDKNELMQIVKDSPDSGLVIISPSITEGVDFKGRLARAQIILKHPIPNIMDPFIKSVSRGVEDIELEEDRDLISRLVYTTILQMYGRVMRNPRDWGVTYIMDQRTVQDIDSILNGRKRREYRRMNVSYLFDGIKKKNIGGSMRFINPITG